MMSTWDIVLCPPYTALSYVADMLEDSISAWAPRMLTGKKRELTRARSAEDVKTPVVFM